MDFLVHSRANSASESPEQTAEEEERLNERHWAYMDAFADRLSARGPTLGPDRETWTGSLHVVDLPDPEAASAFVQNEPYQQAGLFARHTVSRFTNLLGRTMWEFVGSADEPKFLILVRSPAEDRRPALLDDLAPAWRDVLVVYGELRTFDREPAGLALAVQAPSREALDALLTEPSMALSAYRDVEVHDWEFGGRR
jgi:uncharacterized protein YciI